MKGYFGIGIENPKTEMNVGTLWRSAFNLGASFIFTVGKRRYEKQNSDTTKTHRHIPLFRHETLDDLYKSIPYGCMLVGVEYPHEKAVPVGQLKHPERAVYLLGAEDHGLTKKAIGLCHTITYIPTRECLNVAVAGSIVMFDRSRTWGR